MKKILYLTILVMTLMPCLSVYSQLGDLSIIESMSGLIKDNQVPETEDETDIEETSTTKDKPEANFEDNSYGYTGGKNFVNPPQERFFDKPLSYFGYDFFADVPTTFSSATNIPIPPDYVLGPMDNVQIILFGNNNATYNLRVSRDGEIFFPGIGPIFVAGLNFQDFQKTIQEIVTNQIIGTEVSVTLGSLRSINIFVLGEAYQPGMYTISALSTLTNAIFKSGGVRVTGSLRNIELKRRGKTISTFDFYDLLLKGDTSNDKRLMQGDVVFIPPIAKTAGISGEVGRSGIYELKENETLGDLIKFAGHLKPKADISSANLQRVDPSVNGFSLLSVDINDSTLSSFELNDGDVLSIYSVVDNLKNAVLLSGHARQPGFFHWRQGMRLSDLIKSSNDLLSMTDLNYVLIKREPGLTQEYQILQTDLEEIFRDPTSESNVVLNDRDEIVLLPNLLTPERITTRLIRDEFVMEGNQMVLQNKWESLTYLRKSLMQEQEMFDANDSIKNPITGESMGAEFSEEGSEGPGRYYEYTIHDYCVIPKDLAITIVESGGFRAKKSIPLEELEGLSDPADFMSLLAEVENQTRKTLQQETDTDLTNTITNLCRNQLLKPIMEIVARQNTDRNQTGIISVFGNVHFPGDYPLTIGMNLQDALKAGGGLKEATFGSDIELSRREIEDKKFLVTNLVASIDDTNAMTAELQAMDILNVKQISKDIKTVNISGEIYFAGDYPISENQTVAELIKRAGGLTQFGSLKAAYFQRQSLKEAEIERLKNAKNELKRKIVLSSQSGGLGQNSLDANSISQLTTLLIGDDTEENVLGRLVIDLESILNGDSEDLILADGDSLYIPKVQQSVSVIGEVFVANSHIYQDNLSILDYIGLSGGTNNFADPENVYLIKSDGRIIPPSQLSNSGFFRGKADISGIQPGDTIVVPLQIQPFSGIRATTEITQIVYQMALAAAAVNSF